MTTTAPLNVLIVEDEATDAELCARELARGGIPCALVRVDTRKALESALRTHAPDLIISDFSFPGAFDGLAALDLARAYCPDVPFVFVSGTIGEDRAVEALKRGATDYVLKDRLQRLVPVVRRALAESAQRHARTLAEAQLAETRSRLDSILSSISDAVWSVAPHPYRVLYLNPAIEAIWGRPREFFDRWENWTSAVVPEDAPGVAAAWRAMLEHGVPYDTEYRIVRADNDVRWIHARGTPIRAADGAIVRIDGIASDITTRRMQEDRIARLSRIHALLSAINSLIVRERDREKLFDAACRIAVEHTGLRMAWMAMVDTQHGVLQLVACRGHEAGFLEVVGITARPVADHPGAACRAIRERRPVVFSDLAHEPITTLRNEALSRGYRALAALPLLQKEAAAGVMVLYASEPGYFNAEEMKLLEELAGNIAFAMDHIAKTERLDYLAYYDRLTGLPNRNLYFDRLEQLLRLHASARTRAASVVLDIEHFHAINDGYGTAAADALLQQTAERLAREIPQARLVTRLSADRFAFAVPEVAEASDVVRLLEERILRSLSEPFALGTDEIHLQAKSGIALYPADGVDASALVKNAEAALQSAKRDGIRYCFYEPRMNLRVVDRLRLENDLRVAVRNRDFVLHYQPRVSLASGDIVGLEALLRWPLHAEPPIPPSEFIPVLEQTGMIIEVGAWVVREALAQAVRWRAQGLEPPRIAVNVSVLQLRQPDFVPDILDAVAASGAAADWLAIEITESMLMDTIDTSLAKLTQIRAAGIDVVIDDFGTGYSSLSYLAQLPVTALKIDRSFVARMTDNPHHTAIVATIISLGRNLNLQVVAEGVEHSEQAKMLRRLGCVEAQGYLYDKALSADEVKCRLRKADAV